MITGDNVIIFSIILLIFGGIIGTYGILTDNKRRKSENKNAIIVGNFATIAIFVVMVVFGLMILLRIIDQNYVGLVTIFILWALILVFAFLSLFSMNKVKKIKEGQNES